MTAAALKEPKFREGFVEAFDGTKLYYNSTGEGFPIVCSDGIACDMYAWKYILQQFSPKCQVVRWNYRGHGRSEKPSDFSTLTVEQCADDLAVVMDALGIKSAVHLGHSMGVQVILEFYRRHPAYVKALVPMCGSYGHPLKTFHDSDLFHRVFPYVSSFIKKHPEELMGVLKKILPTNFSYFVATLNEINGKLVKQADFMPYFEHLTKLDWALFATMLGYAKDHTTRDMLGTIKVPTIIYGAEHDKFTPVWLSRDMHRLIPGSEFQFLPLGTHTAPIEHPDLIGLRLDKFLSDHFPDEYVPFSAKAPVKKAERKAAAPAGKKIRKAAPKAKRAAQAKKAPGKAAPAADEQPAPDTTGGNA